ADADREGPAGEADGRRVDDERRVAEHRGVAEGGERNDVDARRALPGEPGGERLGARRSPVRDREPGAPGRDERRARGPCGPAGADEDGVGPLDPHAAADRAEEAAAVGVVADDATAAEDERVDRARAL